MIIRQNTYSGKDFEQLEEGFHTVRLARIKDLGLVPNAFDPDKPPQQKVVLIFESLDQEDDEGNPVTIASRKLTASLNEKATLRKDYIKALLGRDLTPEETEFDLDSLIGKEAVISVAHEPRKDGNGTFVSIANINKVPAKRGGKPPVATPSNVESDEIPF